MDLITIRLSQLGEDCIVQNDKGRVFLDLEKCSIAKIGYNEQWELTFNTRVTKKTTAGGKKILAVQVPQTDDERAAKADPVYIGSGLRLFEDGFASSAQYKPSTEAKKAPAPAPMPTPTDSGLPF